MTHSVWNAVISCFWTWLRWLNRKKTQSSNIEFSEIYTHWLKLADPWTCWWREMCDVLCIENCQVVNFLNRKWIIARLRSIKSKESSIKLNNISFTFTLLLMIVRELDDLPEFENSLVLSWFRFNQQTILEEENPPLRSNTRRHDELAKNVERVCLEYKNKLLSCYMLRILSQIRSMYTQQVEKKTYKKLFLFFIHALFIHLRAPRVRVNNSNESCDVRKKSEGRF